VRAVTDRGVVIVQVSLMRPGWACGAETRVVRGHRGLVVLDDAAIEVHDYIVVVMQHWLARGIGRAWQPLARVIAPAGTAVLEGPSHAWEVAF
jgi:hypothetical protein